MRKKGIALFLVLGVIMLVILAASIMLNIVLSQTRLVHHVVSRTQAYYAAKGAMYYTLEKLRKGQWNLGGSYTFCKTTSCTVTDTDLPNSIQKISVDIGGPNSGISGTSLVTVDVNYTYQPY